MTLRITSFNLENLFGRYAFMNEEPGSPKKNPWDRLKIHDVVALDPKQKGGIAPKTISEAQRKNTAAAIRATAPDIMAVVEVENLPTVRMFNAMYLKNYFDRCIVVDGNDPRGIDVGLMVRKGLDAKIVAIRSNADLAHDGSLLTSTNLLDMKRLGNAAFSRDCLEVDVDVDGTELTFLVNHFKAQETRADGDSTTAKRLRQATMAASLAKAATTRGRIPIILGDLNKDVDDAEYDSSLDPLVSDSTLVDTGAALPEEERWTHFWDKRKSVSRLDYILVHKALKTRISDATVFRGGLSPKCKQYSGKRVGTIAQDGLEASDHCAISVDLDI